MAEPKKVSSWLAAAKAAPSAAPTPSSSPDQGSFLKSICTTMEHKEPNGFAAVLRGSQRRKSRSPPKGAKPLLPQGEEFPALESPPKRSSPTGGAAKTGKEGEDQSSVSAKSSRVWGADAVKLIEVPTRNGEKSRSQNPIIVASGGVTAVNEKPAKPTRSQPPLEVTAEFDGLMSELLTGLHSQGSEQGPLHPLTASPQRKGLLPGKVVLPPQAQKTVQEVAVTPVQNHPVDAPRHMTPLSRVLFPSQTLPLAPGAKPPAPKTVRTKPVTPPQWPIPTNPKPINTSHTPSSKELSFFAVPPKTPNSYSPKSVLDLSSPEGSPTLRLANQTPPARPSAYRPAMYADPKKIIGRRTDVVTAVQDAVTSSPFSYSLWGSPDHPLTSAEPHVLRESPCNVVREANPARVSRLGGWLGKETGGLLETESEFHQALFRGKIAQPAPFAQAAAAETGPEDDDSCCKICFERESNSAYLCGHMLCADCAEHIHVHKKVCPFCAKPIETVLRVFA